MSNRRDPLGSLWAFSSASILPTRGVHGLCRPSHRRLLRRMFISDSPTTFPLFYSVSPTGTQFFRLSRSVRSRLAILPRSDVSRTLSFQSTSLNTSSTSVSRQGRTTSLHITHTTYDMSPTPMSPVNRLSHPERTTSQDSTDGIRKRVCKACDRCRLKKSKCDGSSPCSRCKADNAICVFGYVYYVAPCTLIT